jgi:hypothetical protein
LRRNISQLAVIVLAVMSPVPLLLPDLAHWVTAYLPPPAATTNVTPLRPVR